MRILVIEDQEMPWRNFKLCLTQMCGIDEACVTRVRSREAAITNIAVNKYNVILLDHRILYREVDFTDEENLVDFSNCLENIGYDLIPWIEKKNPNATIVGTSSFSQNELRGYESPKLSINKINLFKELPLLITSLR